MCGIAGCVGRSHATQFVTDSLEALEYRGYDSVGIAYLSSQKLKLVKTLGGVTDLRTRLPQDAIKSTVAIGHTRWATHGQVSVPNTHPHTNRTETIGVVCNGIIENYSELRDFLKSNGYKFVSETDTEVIPNLIDYYVQKNRSPGMAFEETLKQLEGAYAILAYFTSQPDTIYAAKLGSPLVLGMSGGEYFAASDPSVLVDHTEDVIFLDDHEIAKLSADGYKLKHIKKGTDTTRKPEQLGEAVEKAKLGNFPHFMLKEIYDSPDTVRSAISGRVRPNQKIIKLGGLESKKEQLRNIQRVIIVACGTSYHAGLVGERLIEEVAGIPVEVQMASEFQYRNEPFDRETAIIAISQSGETADTIGALKKAEEFGMLKLGIVNTPGSTIDRVTDAGVHCRAGQEVSVASTKAFTSQVTVLAEIALALSKKSNTLTQPIMDELVALPGKIEEILADTSDVEAVAKKYANFKNFLYVGRGYDYATAMEGALKLKEISYIHAEGCGAGEMKHGTLALIDEDFPTMAIATDGELYDKTLSNIEEIRARKGPLVALASKGNKTAKDHADDVLYVPRSLEQTQPILNSIVLQLFAYYVAVEKGLNVDRPRNLAKSVTVE
jgi:glucosamine--fructose-6-phosphate aminotransferase (isomerizing)